MTLFTPSTSRTLLATAILSAATPVISGTSTDNFTIEEIVVTAQKRSQSLQEVPVTISAFSDDFLKQTGSSDIADLALYTPGLQADNTFSGFPSIVMRGIGSNDFGIGSDPSVGIYMDGIYMGRSGGSVIDLLDVERVEVVKGPQGTLFGRNATGGAINVISQKPSYEFEGNVGASFGRFNEQIFEGTVNVPLIDNTLAMRVSGRKKDRDGWQENVPSDNGDGAETDRGNLKASILWEPSDNFSVIFANDWYREKENFGYSHLLGGVYVDPALTGGLPLPVDPAVLADSRSTGLVTLINDADSFNTLFANIGEGPIDTRSFDSSGRKYFTDGTVPLSDRVVRGHSITADWEINDNLSLNSITAYRQHDVKVIYENDGTTLAGLDVPNTAEKTETYSQEFRLNGHSETVDWFVGASAYKEDSYGLSAATSSVYSALGIVINDTTESTVKAESYALYADGTWHINELWSLSAGGRYSYDNKTINTTNPLTSSGSIFPPGLDEKKHDSWSNFSPRLAVDYNFNEDTLIFSSITKGYKSGGFNTYPSQANEPAFDPEEVINLELGIKSTLMDGRLQLNASVFSYQYEDLQQLQSQNGSLQIVNAGEASGQGLEVDVTFRATQSLTLIAALGWTAAEYDSFDLPISFDADGDGVINPLLGEFEGDLDLSGEDTARTPNFTGTLGMDYFMQLDELGSLRLNGSYTYTGKQRLSSIPLAIYEEDGYGLLNARVTYVTADESIEISAYGSNLTDEDYMASRGDSGDTLGFIAGRRGEPRTYGINATLFF